MREQTTSAQYAVDGQMNRKNQKQTIKRLTVEQKIRAALDLYYSARELKAAGLRAMHPGMSKEEIDKKVREIFLYAGN